MQRKVGQGGGARGKDWREGLQYLLRLLVVPIDCTCKTFAVKKRGGGGCDTAIDGDGGNITGSRVAGAAGCCESASKSLKLLGLLVVTL